MGTAGHVRREAVEENSARIGAELVDHIGRKALGGTPSRRIVFCGKRALATFLACPANAIIRLSDYDILKCPDVVQATVYRAPAEQPHSDLPPGHRRRD
jgi:hypothetical protein